MSPEKRPLAQKLRVYCRMEVGYTMKKATQKYKPGMFHLFQITDALDCWDGFPEIMWGLGYNIDACKSFEAFRKSSKLKLKPAHSEREDRRNTLYLLEHADRQIIGNYLFSMWRYYTHWSCYHDHYDVDFLRRIIRILEQKYAYHKGI